MDDEQAVSTVRLKVESAFSEETQLKTRKVGDTNQEDAKTEGVFLQ